MAQIEWTLESLNKAYQQGYMTGLAGRPEDDCTLTNDVLIAAWEAGWDDGNGHYHKTVAAKKSESARSA